MCERVQISCEKQGRDDTSSWSTRVLTVDPATGTLTISRHHHTNNVFYHSVQVKEIQQWPHFPRTTIDEAFESLHAKRTLCVLGREVPVPSFSLACTENEDAAPVPMQHGADATSDSSSSPATQYTFMAGDTHKKSRPLESGGWESWVIRFTTEDAYEVAVAALYQLPDVHFNPKHSTESATMEVFNPPPVAAGLAGPL